MSYEYKEEILLDIGPEPHCNYGSEYDRYYDKIEELDHVYAQAALNKEKIKQIEETYKVRYSEHIELKRKADDYEAKASAFDEIIYAINSSSNAGLNGNSYIDAIDFTSKVEYIVLKFESEFETDAKK